MKKKFLLSCLSFILGLLLIVWVYQKFDLKEIFLRFGFLNWQQITALFLFTLIKFLIWTIRWQLILREIGFDQISFRKLFSARLGEMSLSYLTPGIYYGGEVVRLLAIKKQVPILYGLVAIISERIIEITSFGLFTLCGVFILLLKQDFFGVFLFGILAIVPLALIFLIFRLLRYNQFSKLTKIFNFEKLNNSNYDNNGGQKENLSGKMDFIKREVIIFFKRPSPIIFMTIILSFFSFLTGAIQLSIFLNFLGEHGNFFKIILIRILTLFSGTIPIPATLGVYEGVSVLAFQNYGLTAETALGFALITRLIDFIFVIVGLLIIGYYLTHKFLTFLSNKKEESQ